MKTLVRAVVALSLALAAPARARAPARHVTLLHVTDLHAQLESHPEYVPGTPGLPLMGGFARLRTALDRERAAAPGAVFAVDGGDTFQGSGPAAWSRGEVVIEPLRALGLDLGTPGNWEVAYGAPRFRELMRSAPFPELAYNLHDTASGERILPPALTLERGGVKVLFVGITDPTTTLRQAPSDVSGLDSTRLGGLEGFVRELRRRERPDLVVAVMHSGLTVSRRFARDVPVFDVVLSGHTHERTDEVVRVGKTLVVEPGSMGSFIGRLDLTVGKKGGVVRHAFRLVPVRAETTPEDARVKELVDAALAPHRARMERVVGRTGTPILRYDVLETTGDDFITDAVREAAGTQIGLGNGFRFGVPIPAGAITEGQLWDLLPMDGNLKKGSVTGRQLRAYLERELELVFSRDPWKLSGGWGPRLSGVTMTLVSDAPAGQRVRALAVGGVPVEDDARYTIAGCEREGEPEDTLCRIRGVADPAAVATTLHHALEAYLARHPVVNPVVDRRVVALDLPARVPSQDAVLRASARRRARAGRRHDPRSEDGRRAPHAVVPVDTAAGALKCNCQDFE